jgi:hypothetical protein
MVCLIPKYPDDSRCINVSNPAPPSDLPATRLEDDSSLPPLHPDAFGSFIGGLDRQGP